MFDKQQRLVDAFERSDRVFLERDSEIRVLLHYLLHRLDALEFYAIQRGRPHDHDHDNTEQRDRKVHARRVGQPSSEHGLRKQHMQLANSVPAVRFPWSQGDGRCQFASHIAARRYFSAFVQNNVYRMRISYPRRPVSLGTLAYGTSVIASVGNSGLRGQDPQGYESRRPASTGETYEPVVRRSSKR